LVAGPSRHATDEARFLGVLMMTVDLSEDRGRRAGYLSGQPKNSSGLAAGSKSSQYALGKPMGKLNLTEISLTFSVEI